MLLRVFNIFPTLNIFPSIWGHLKTQKVYVAVAFICSKADTGDVFLQYLFYNKHQLHSETPNGSRKNCPNSLKLDSSILSWHITVLTVAPAVLQI